TPRVLYAPDPAEPPAEPEHPAWCDRRGCAARQEHRSPQLAANPTGRELVGIFVTLVQLTIADAPPTVEVLFAESRTEEVVQVVDVAQGIALAYRLRRVADWAAGRMS
ncbi:hypothetical protein DLJ47_06695, partial [Micromonospora sp. S4605]|uniref:hypothetical protein n=1 Tax=Micromonospora sp. S4605 TaxID=1420897 RepID=UPI000D89EB6D